MIVAVGGGLRPCCRDNSILLNVLMKSMAPPTYKRRTVIAAAHMLKALGHSGVDRFLLELGSVMQGVASRDRGGLDARATALAEFALENPQALSDDRRTIPFEIVLRAKDIWERGIVPNLAMSDRDNFADAMRAEGSPLGADPLGSEDELPATPPIAATPDTEDHSMAKPRKVFIVHGHGGIEQEVARFLERIGFESIILSEQVNRGRTIIEKIEANSDVGYAVVLMTADDVGGKSKENLAARARQNVVLEWGYFAGKLGRSNVHAIKRGEIELPSDLLGLAWTSFALLWTGQQFRAHPDLIPG
ncbi:MAG: TIR domain-containing protein [Thermomicrobiales bacterium]